MKNGVKRKLTDMEAAVAYFGCSGAWIKNGVFDDRAYVRWKEKGKGKLTTSSAGIAKEREQYLKDTVYGGMTYEFWDCVKYATAPATGGGYTGCDN